MDWLRRKYNYYRYKVKHFIHWRFGIHFFKPLGVVGVRRHEEKSGRYVWCIMCGIKFEASKYLFDKLYKP